MELAEARAQALPSPSPFGTSEACAWNLLIDGYSKSGYLSNADNFKDFVNLCNDMRWSGMSPSDSVLSLIIHCCASFYVRRLGKVLYCKFLSFAKSVYNEMPRKDVVANNAMISALIYHGFVKDAQNLFHSMREKNSVAWNSMITCYSKIGNVKSAQFVFDHNPIKDVASWNAMIHGYSKAGQLSLAEAKDYRHAYRPFNTTF
ncbi:Pentatricopeptide repeat-containing protein [Artemisia annua]|uniref:Pentatricopeptide repeat-containing protein n=1 Tax=Artemisia annua TaxID=35608 RepID=A0A2U1LXN8_ARTAN|nr:Pentatricopeptide repeat-containing protein [Artemisia annua]